METWKTIYAGERPEESQPAQPGSLPLSARGIADSEAAWRRWHRNRHDDRFTSAEWPWYIRLERARVAVRAGRDLPGMASNLKPSPAGSGAANSGDRIYRLAMAELSGAGQRTVGETTLASTPPQRNAPAQDRTRSLWQWLRRPQSGPEAPGFPDLEFISAELREARHLVDDEAAFAERIRPLVQALAAAGPDIPPEMLARDQPGAENDTPARAAEPEVDDTTASDKAPDEPAAPETSTPTESDGFVYRVFSRRWDQEIPAERLFHAGEDWDANCLPECDRRQARRLALALQRRLTAARLDTWSFDREDGQLDSRRLSRLLGAQAPYRVFRKQQSAPLPEACVTLLVDQSGSMRGEPQRLTAQAIDLAAWTLDYCRVPCEILGYTTRYGADNPVADAWQAAGQPAQPGRLNALLHIVYKTPRQTWRTRRRYLGLLLRPDIVRENFDGEAVAWAANRLLRRPEARKILVVLADGQPHEPATAAANGRGYLEDHLHQVIAGLGRTPIHLSAIGAGHDVGRFYTHTLMLRSAQEAAAELFRHLGDLLTSPNLDPSRHP